MEEQPVQLIPTPAEPLPAPSHKDDKEMEEHLVKSKEVPMTIEQQIALAESMGTVPPLVNSDSPERQKDEHPYQYKWRRKIMKDWEKQHRVGIPFFVSVHAGQQKGKTFKKKNYSKEDLLNAELTIAAKLRGIDLNKIPQDKK